MPESVVYNEDCMSVMSRYQDKYFELAIVDPPYFSGPEKRKFYGREISLHGVKRINYNQSENTWTVPDEKYFKELERVSKHQIIWGCNYYNYLFNGSGRIVWDKVNDHSSFSDCEIAYCSKIDHVRIFRYMWSGMMQGTGDGTSKKMQGRKDLNEKRIHPTQKPIALYKWLLIKYAIQGDKILDTHLGSGTSRIAADELGFDFVGCELSKIYFDKHDEKFKQYKNQLTIF
jgi:site-specific DNA-methyltransferase (adenine-specific)